MADHDVVISGGGPAGLLLGCLLAQAGREVAVFERSDSPDGRTRAIGIHPPGLAALGAAGLAEDVLAEAAVLSGGVVTSRGRVLADLDLPPERPVLTLAQTRTEALLRARLETLSPGALRTGTTVLHAADDATSVRVSALAEGRVEEHRADLLVVAEGVRSGLRGTRRFGWRSVPGSAWYSMLDVTGADDDDRARLHLEPAGVVESFPLPGGRRWVLREGERRTRTPASFRAEVGERCGIDIGTVGAVPTAFRARQHRAGRLVRDRTVLLGDAAHEISPIGGQGMNIAWIAACRLAVAVTDRADRVRALDAYQRVTMRTAAIAQRRALFNMTVGAPWPDAPRALRDVAIRALARGATGERLLAAMTMGGL